MFMVPCIIIYSMKQPTDAATCFGCFIHPSSGVQFLNVSTATGTNHSIVSATYSQCGLVLWFVPVAVGTVKNCTPDDGCIKHPKHVE